MSKVMDTTALKQLLGRMAGEYAAKRTIFEIPEAGFRETFALEARSPDLKVMSGVASLPVGPAAGPHSQIAPNIVAAYLAGARTFELKTVQENDSLDIEKPCIEAFDEGHNTEWSTELSLDQARDEYLNAWIAVNLLAAVFSSKPKSFLFNISVGYTLAGIKGARVNAYIEAMRSPSRLPQWANDMHEVSAFVESPGFLAAFGSDALAKARALVAAFPAKPVHSVTISTMHGCPPAEIEGIGAYLIEEKGFDTFVKLNPTLLGYYTVRGILDHTGWKDIGLKRDTFEHDLQFKDALGLIRSLSKKAEDSGLRFGIKLSNTLANENTGGFLPGAERYMSGRALFAVTTRLAADLAAALPEFDQRFSYCGGASALNVAELIAAGMGPVTVATDVLKPGGYLRFGQMAEEAVRALPGSPERPDAKKLAALAAAALERPEYRKAWKQGRGRIERKLPLFDCFAAPCIEACPVKQKAPAYIRLAAAGDSRAAIETILADNPLPFITGTLCDHVCQEACNRNDYEGSVEIRASKLGCAKAASLPVVRAKPAAFKGRVAVIGAGPAGLACAHHLALAGVPVTVFDRASGAGGVPANTLPAFRIEASALKKDIERIESLGVEFRFGADVDSLGKLEAEGFTSFFACSGAPVPKPLAIEGSGVRVVDALAFLESARGVATGGGAGDFAGIKHVVVAGGGNTAMDAVRVATRIPGINEVRLSYRRSLEEMPADKEELGNALAEGGKLMALSLPERAIPASGAAPSSLVLRLMELGEKDASGRRSPRPSDRTESVHCDLLVAAIGESADRSLLEKLGATYGKDGKPVYDKESQATARKGLYLGGDAARGPSSIISAAADGRRAAYAIMREAGIEPPKQGYRAIAPEAARLAARGRLQGPLAPVAAGFAQREADRCLSCDSACLRCVEVCPNRANMAIPGVAAPWSDTSIAEPWRDAFQILHVDALCNECGNCGVFCPFEGGEPYRHKATLFSGRKALEASKNSGFAFAGTGRLAYRTAYEGPVAEIEASAMAASREPMVVLARSIHKDHAYLNGGSK